jgi:hypothetical protein
MLRVCDYHRRIRLKLLTSAHISPQRIDRYFKSDADLIATQKLESSGQAEKSC